MSCHDCLCACLLTAGARPRTSRQVLHEGTPWLVHAPHEGLVLERAACEEAVRVLFDTPAGKDLYNTSQPVEEFALQSVATHAGLRFNQLSDMAGPEPLRATEELRMPLTKCERPSEAEAEVAAVEVLPHVEVSEALPDGGRASLGVFQRQ